MRNPTAEARVALGSFQEVDDLGQLTFGLVDAGYIRKRGADPLGINAPRRRAAEVPQRTGGATA
jgi:hypothetical protein